MVRVSKYFRYWFYFRQGWSQYLAYVIGAVNTLTVTYFLAIENYPVLGAVFPSFLHYILIMVAIGFPLLLLLGYLHFKKSEGYKAEANITMESHPHFQRILQNSEKMLKLHFQMNEFLLKINSDKELTPKDLEKIKDIQDELSDYMKNKTM